uniref:Uncharacterized protein n=1 Tax=Meloidogyne enterolobii TaxID=390850 RepID=A0A6V7W1M5_MELEN|nr:unnamed protein product [Meloidogyne enterolobii]
MPNVPKNIEEMIIIRFWLEQLFKCAVREGRFREIVFNPKLLNLLFDDDKTIPSQFNFKELHVGFTNNLFNNSLNFTLNHLTNSTNLYLYFNYVNNLEEYINILFNILINEGNKFPKVTFHSCGLTRLFVLIIEYIATSKDCSKMVPVIYFDYIDYSNFELKKLAKNV